MHYFLLIYYNNKALHFPSRLAVQHHVALFCIYSNWYCNALRWLYKLLFI